MEESAFPRGSGAGKSVSEQQQQRKRSSSIGSLDAAEKPKKKLLKTRKDDFLFDQEGRRGKKSHIKKKSSSLVKTLPQGISIGGGGVLPASQKNKEALIESLTFSKLEVGTKVLGVVRPDGIHEDYALISLPNMLTGYIRRGIGGGSEDVPLTKVLSPLQILPVSIQSLSTSNIDDGSSSKKKKQQKQQASKRIELSVLPKDLNAGLSADQLYLPGLIVRGEIKSMEDHGCIVDLGLKGIGSSALKAFLQYDNAPGYDIEKGDLSVGKCLDFRVKVPKSVLDIYHSSSGEKKKKKKKILHEMEVAASSHLLIQLSLPPKGEQFPVYRQVAQASGPSAIPSSSSSSFTLKSLTPGMLVECNVEEYAKNGLLVTFMKDVFRGSIDENHLGYFRPEPNVLSNNTMGAGKADSSGGGWRHLWKEQAYVSQVTARIIAVDPVTKILRLSLLPHLLAMKISDNSDGSKLNVGDIISNTSVIRVDNSFGVLLGYNRSSAKKDDEEDDDDDDDSMEGSDDEDSDSASNSDSSSDDDDGDDEEEKSGMKRKIKTKEIEDPDQITVPSHPLESYFNRLSKMSKNKGDAKSTTLQMFEYGIYVHASKAMDSDGDNSSMSISEVELRKLFYPKQSSAQKNRQVRILSTNHESCLLENYYLGSTSKSIVNAHVLTYSDLKPGKVYKQAEIVSYNEESNSGVLVSLGHNIRAMCPWMHVSDTCTAFASAVKSGSGPSTYISDYQQKAYKIKYGVGKKIDVKVLSVDPENKKAFVTFKKSLVDDALEPLADLNIKPNDTFVGYITKVSNSEEGIVVSFYGGVYGFCPAKRLANEMGIEKPQEVYKVGQVVKCRVVSSSTAHKRRLELSLDLSHGAQQKEIEKQKELNVQEKKSSLLTVGMRIPASAMKVIQMVEGKRKSNGYAIVSVKLKSFLDKKGEVECRLPYEQLEDTYPFTKASKEDNQVVLNKVAEELFTVGKKLKRDAVVLIPSDASVTPTLSLRPTFVELSSSSDEGDADDDEKNKNDTSSSSSSRKKIKVPSMSSDLYIGSKIIGYVTQIDLRHGAFVRFSGIENMTGLIPKLKKGLEEKLYSTICVKVTGLDLSHSQSPRIILKKSSMKKKNYAGSGGSNQKTNNESIEGLDQLLKKGEYVGDVLVEDVDFYRAKVKLLNKKYRHEERGSNIRARVHVTMAKPSESTDHAVPVSNKKGAEEKEIKEHHPFYNWRKGQIIPDTVCMSYDILSKDDKDDVALVELTNRADLSEKKKNKVPKNLPLYISSMDDLQLNVSTDDTTNKTDATSVRCIITNVLPKNAGVKVLICPGGVSTTIPALELSKDIKVLNHLSKHFHIGQILTCKVTLEADDSHQQHGDQDGNNFQKKKHKKKNMKERNKTLSLLLETEQEDYFSKPKVNDIMVCKITHYAGGESQNSEPFLHLKGRNGYTAKCCLTELDDAKNWINMPLGKTISQQQNNPDGNTPQVTDEEDGNDVQGGTSERQFSTQQSSQFPIGKYVQCKVLSSKRRSSLLEVSLRKSRIISKEDVGEEEIPKVGDVIKAYVVGTNKKGCFVQYSRHVTGRIILKELTDGFIPDPIAAFPPGRLVEAKVKAVQDRDSNRKNTEDESNSKQGDSVKSEKESRRIFLDLDMRESSLYENDDVDGKNPLVTLQTLKAGQKHKGVITRMERYGVFVRLENSCLFSSTSGTSPPIQGLAHISECVDSEKPLTEKQLHHMYDPGDYVKAYVLGVDKENKKVSFSLKASYFEDDSDSSDSDDDDDDDSSVGSSSSDEEDVGIVSDDDSAKGEEMELDSDDEDYVAKLSQRMNKKGDEDDSESGSSSSEEEDSGDEDSDSDSDSDDEADSKKDIMDTNVGFDWDGSSVNETSNKKKKTTDNAADDSSSSSDSDSDEDSDDEDNKAGSSNKKKNSKKRREKEREISEKETALAEGLMDANPTTQGDFERLIASEPNLSEHWIKYMAYYLTLGDIDSARKVASRAFSRIEFREEKEKLNVWTALLTLELKYGDDKSLQTTIANACQQNNAKQVYLRVCEMLVREVENANATNKNNTHEIVQKANEMFTKMCKKFKSKKTVWIAYFEYLLKVMDDHKEAHAVLKRSLKSLPEYKHIETMSKFAYMELEHGSKERGRTILDGLLEKYPKRMDLLFVYIDKELKSGEIEAARDLFQKTYKATFDTGTSSKKRKFNDKQMKSLFKKWFRMEETHGDSKTQEDVKSFARSYVERSSSR